MRIFVASFINETNHFAPMPVGIADFEAGGLFDGRDGPLPMSGATEILSAWRDAGERDGHEVVEGLAAFALPSGLLTRATYATLSDRLLAGVAAAASIDVVLLHLHGAMGADGIPDCEGDLMVRLRAQLGREVAIGAVLDLHCQLTAAMVGAADIIIANKEYPHTDTAARAAEVYAIAVATRRGEVSPVAAIADTGIVGFWPTSKPAMRSFVDEQLFAREGGKVLSVTLAHAFPWADMDENSARALVYTDGDAVLARQAADYIATRFWDEREAVRTHPTGLEVGLDRALAADRWPVVIADMADNAGGGAASDSTFILAALVARGAHRTVLGGVCDPGAVRICHAVGEGAKLRLRVGGKVSAASGAPLDLDVSVLRCVKRHEQSFYGSVKVPLGDASLIAVGGIQVLLTSIRCQIMGTDAFTALGVDLSDARLIVVKSSFHFRQYFEPLAAEIIEVNTPGTLRADVEALPFVRRTKPFWPRDPLCGPPLG